MKIKRLYIRKLSKLDIDNVLFVLGNGNINNVDKKDVKIIKTMFKEKWIGYGYFIMNYKKNPMIGYCFIKFPLLRPESMTVVHEKYRNLGIATELRNHAIQQREFIGHILYSSVKFDNLASFKSILKSGYQVFDVTKDGMIQLMKVLEYDK